MPRSVFAASWTAASAAFAKLSGEEPMIVTTFANSTCLPLFLGLGNWSDDDAIPADRVLAPDEDVLDAEDPMTGCFAALPGVVERRLDVAAVTGKASEG